MMGRYEDYTSRKRREFGDKFDDSDLAPQFAPYFDSGDRVRVRFPWGEEATGTIGVSTGWRPAFLLMRRSNAHGSSDVLGHDCVITARKRTGERAYVAIR